ncbi:hypothetical protein BLNAU_8788 [Blattamonas nauphoetae]|uniref:Uncharacterized protein n=1 Tax=Blattamonas nauphoetae TaxID=2049346 RepID=A0ABQ9XXP3_9EUKA|nr:hypothetical protein BLNAU_8788 [Blattamonas nauphoetae]
MSTLLSTHHTPTDSISILNTVCMDEKSHPTKQQSPIFKVILLALAFCSLTIATQPSMNYMSSLFPSLCGYIHFFYGFTLTFSAIFAPIIIRKFGGIASLQISAILAISFSCITYFVLWTTNNGQNMETWTIAVLFIGVLLNGLSNQMMWGGWTWLMNSMTTPSTVGAMTGMFYSIYHFNSPIGNLLGSALFGLGWAKSSVVLTFTGFGIVGVALMIVIGITQSSPCTCTRKKAEAASVEKKEGLCSSLASLFSVLKCFWTYPVMFCYILQRCIGAFFSSVFGETVQHEGDSVIGIGFATAGVMMIVGSTVFGKILDKVSKRAALFLSLFFGFICLLCCTICYALGGNVIMFCVAHALNGLFVAGMDVNVFWLAMDGSVSHGNVSNVVQISRSFSNIFYAAVGLLSSFYKSYGEVFVWAFEGILIVLLFMLWVQDATQVSMTKVKEMKEKEEREEREEEMAEIAHSPPRDELGAIPEGWADWKEEHAHHASQPLFSQTYTARPSSPHFQNRKVKMRSTMHELRGVSVKQPAQDEREELLSRHERRLTETQPIKKCAQFWMSDPATNKKVVSPEAQKVFDQISQACAPGTQTGQLLSMLTELPMSIAASTIFKPEMWSEQRMHDHTDDGAFGGRLQGMAGDGGYNAEVCAEQLDTQGQKSHPSAVQTTVDEGDDQRTLSSEEFAHSYASIDGVTEFAASSPSLREVHGD